MTTRRACLLVCAAALLLPVLCARRGDAAPSARRSAKSKTAAAPTASPLPILGTRLSEFPPGKEKAIADKGCLQCHSADIPLQQRLTEKQWTAEVEKMMRWGAEVSESDKAALVSYLAAHFGPDNDRFIPVAVAPLSSPRPAH